MCTSNDAVSSGVQNVTVSAAAEKFFRRVLRFSGKAAGAGVRLTVSPGGCSGLHSEFSVEEAPYAGDAVLDVNGMALFVPGASCALLEGVTIDFVDTPTQSGLTFLNPKAGACACASSAPTGRPAGVARIDVTSIRPALAKGAPR